MRTKTAFKYDIKLSDAGFYLVNRAFRFYHDWQNEQGKLVHWYHDLAPTLSLITYNKLTGNRALLAYHNVQKLTEIIRLFLKNTPYTSPKDAACVELYRLLELDTNFDNRSN